MDSSRRRNSILDWLIAATLATAAISGLAGIDLTIGGISFRSHGALRVLAVAAVVAAIRWRLGIDSAPVWLARVALLTAICGSAGTWFRFLLMTVGGADSYGYVSASQLLAEGRLIGDAPIAQWLSSPNRMALASPLGWTPSPDNSGISPTFPIGVSALMALFTLIGGSGAVFFVAPVAGAITLFLIYRLACEWYDADTALFATALVAWNPLFIAYAKQPMSDVPATMWMVLAVFLAVRSTPVTALGAGLAAAAAVITRPALLIAGAVVPLAARRGDRPFMRAALAAAAFAIGVGVQLAIQNHLFGSPFSSGYGAAGNLFSINHVPTNLWIFTRHLWTVVGPLWLVGLILGLMAARPEPRAKPAAIFVAVTAPYLFYLPFDHWETLRFLLPGLAPLTIVAADGLIKIARSPLNRAATAVITCAFLAIVVVQSAILLRNSSVWDVAALEERYPLAGDWINVNTPTNSVVLANQHSGSLRWYGKRETLRWDFIAPEDLAKTVREIESHGATTYVALEGDEERMFDTRFANVIDRMQVDHVGRIRNVHFRRLTSRAGNPVPGSSLP
ncbi:MAG TPA: glycosyltransferase family 39 protein [Vicinamibacterales bacterium]|nr:glycosyltransferase family 39 protein [Vicinamibacterales bacterium]